MKKIILSVAALTLLFGATLLTSCTKDDTTAPVITVKQPNPATVILGSTYTDAGATANDDKDGDLTSSIVSDVSATNPNVNLKGTYTINYTVSDAAGNTGTATRTVNVVNALESMAGSYTVNGVYDGSPDTYYTAETVSTSSTTNNKIIFAKFLAYQDALVYATISGNTITIPAQTYTCGTGTGRDSRDFVGTGSVTDATHFMIQGTVALTSAPTVTINWNYTFTKN